MEVYIRNIPFVFDELQLNRELATVLHGPYFREYMGGAPFNFLVRIFKAKNPRQRQHGGCGILIVPSIAIGSQFIQLARMRVVNLHGRALYAEAGRAQAKPEDIAFLGQPYQDPTVVEEQRRRNAEIKGKIKLQNLQLGWPCHDWAISVEWETPAYHHPWALEFDPETRRFVINSQTGLRVVVALNNVQSMAIDSHACVMWLERPPILEREKTNMQDNSDEVDQLTDSFSRLNTGNIGPTRDRLVTLDEIRGDIFGFLRVIRIVFEGHHALEEFKSKAMMVGITTYVGNYGVSKQGLFDPFIMGHFHEWLTGLSFDLAFQIDGLVSRCRFNPKELRKMKRIINAAVEKYGEAIISDSIRMLEQRRDEDKERRTASDLFSGILLDLDRSRAKKQIRQSNQSGEIFQCHRVAVTPTSLILSGPLPDETNRVLRKYMDHQSHFIRVEFRDEDRLHLRLDREVDSPKFLEERIGTILQRGLVIAGRHFEFLAYR